MGAGEPNLARPLTRSSIKPRLLFPPQPKIEVESTLEEEEAVTDVEDHLVAEAEAADLPVTPTKASTSSGMPKTPSTPRFGAAMSPPDTKKATRAGEKLGEEKTPIKAKAPGRRSPFDSWPRVKDHSAAAASHKRHGETLAPAPAKRAKN